MKKFKAWAIVDNNFKGINGVGVYKLTMHHRKDSAHLSVEKGMKVIQVEIREVKAKKRRRRRDRKEDPQFKCTVEKYWNPLHRNLILQRGSLSRVGHTRG